jgi:hypothetical protein
MADNEPKTPFAPRSLTSAELREQEDAEGGNARLAPTPEQLNKAGLGDPDLDPNTDRGGGASSTAAPARTEMTREDFIAANVVQEPKPDAPGSTLNSRGATAARDEDAIRKENAKKASKPGTTANVAKQQDSSRKRT